MNRLKYLMRLSMPEEPTSIQQISTPHGYRATRVGNQKRCLATISALAATGTRFFSRQKSVLGSRNSVYHKTTSVPRWIDRKSTRLHSSHVSRSYAVFRL